jgi:pSer/pThr/pTyr-binding forkhead associated (FHA) protein
MDGTLQFLPGRLEIVDGRELGQEVRFIRQPGPGPTEVTFGRQEGVPYRHVQLYEPTVSRLHAKVTQEGANWRLTNLSRTNPVSVNGASMAPQNTSVLLKEGDRIEMGEVVFLFHAK